MRTSFRGRRGWEENAVLIYPSPPAKVSLRAKLKGVLVSKDRGVSFFSHLILDSPGRKGGRGETLLFDRHTEWVPTANSLIIIRLWETAHLPLP